MYKYLIVILFTLVLLPLTAFSKPIVICYEDMNYEPYVFETLGNEGEPRGLLVETIQSAAKFKGLQIQFIRRPWLRCQQLVKNNQVQALFAMIKTPQRKIDYSFPPNVQQKLLTVEYGIFIKRNGLLDDKKILTQLSDKDQFLDINEYQRVQKYGLSAPLGYVVHKWLIKHEVSSNFNYSLSDGIKSVSKEKLDGYVVAMEIGEHFVKNNGLHKDIKWSGVKVISRDWHLAFSNKYYQTNTEQVELFWKAINNTRLEILNR